MVITDGIECSFPVAWVGGICVGRIERLILIVNIHFIIDSEKGRAGTMVRLSLAARLKSAKCERKKKQGKSSCGLLSFQKIYVSTYVWTI